MAVAALLGVGTQHTIGTNLLAIILIDALSVASGEIANGFSVSIFYCCTMERLGRVISVLALIRAHILLNATLFLSTIISPVSFRYSRATTFFQKRFLSYEVLLNSLCCSTLVGPISSLRHRFQFANLISNLMTSSEPLSFRARSFFSGIFLHT